MGLFTDGFKELKKASEPLFKTPKSIQETIEILAVAEMVFSRWREIVTANVICFRILTIPPQMRLSRSIYLSDTASC